MAASLASSVAAAQSLSAARAGSLVSTRASLPAFSGLKAVAVSAIPAKHTAALNADSKRPVNTPRADLSTVTHTTAVPSANGTGTTYYVVNITFPATPAATTAAVAVPAAEAAPAVLPAATAAAAPNATAAVPRVRQAALPALASMAKFFPNARQEDEFLHSVALELNKLGFRKDNGIALVNTCRDEVCRALVTKIDSEFGLSFNVSGLGGLVNCGKTGFKAAMSHSPEFLCDVDGTIKERYIFFAFPHVSVGEAGEVGSLLRRGRGKASSACGALIAIKNDINAGGEVNEDDDDAEYVLLKQKVMGKVQRKKDGELLSLVQVTKGAMQAINEDLEKLIELTVDPATADYAVITGVQIHSGNQVPGEPFRSERTCDYIAPDKVYAVVRGKRYDLQLDGADVTEVLQA